MGLNGGTQRRWVRLAPGVRLSDRGHGAWQLGLHADHRVVLTPDPATHALLVRLRTGVDEERLPEGSRPLLARLGRAGLLASCAAPPAPGPVAVDAVADQRGAVARALVAAGLTVTDGDAAALTLVLRTGAEPRREDLDPWVREDRAHLLVTAVAGRVRLGPLVVPGTTACLRCVDAHHTDRDPRHPLVVHHHHDRDPDDVPVPGDLALALAWAARDARCFLTAGRPTTWSSTVDLTEDGPRVHPWSRHPHCGCAWDAALRSTG